MQGFFVRNFSYAIYPEKTDNSAAFCCLAVAR
jgi:hypothetical protein